MINLKALTLIVRLVSKILIALHQQLIPRARDARAAMFAQARLWTARNLDLQSPPKYPIIIIRKSAKRNKHFVKASSQPGKSAPRERPAAEGRRLFAQRPIILVAPESTAKFKVAFDRHTCPPANRHPSANLSRTRARAKSHEGVESIQH